MKLKPASINAFKKHLENHIRLNDEELDQMLGYFSYKKLKKHKVLISAGDAVRHTYWTIKGLLTSTHTDASGKEHIIQFANENCWITDQNAFYNKTKAQFTIVCNEDSELLCLSFDDRERLCAVMPKAERFFRIKANDSFVKQQKRLLTHLASDAQKRYELLLSEYPNLIQRLPKKTLAAYLGVSRETLSRFK